MSWTLQGIRDRPGVGNDIVAVALHSPSIQNRNAAINALEAWGAEHWTTEHRQRLTGSYATLRFDAGRKRRRMPQTKDHELAAS